MNDLLERYLAAVCVYFFGNKKKKVYNSLKNTIRPLTSQYDDMEAMLLKFGHPKSVAYSYGYRPFIHHIFNKDIVNKTEKSIFVISGIYLFFSTLYYLYQFNCLPFLTNPHIVYTLDGTNPITWLLSHPFIVMCSIFLFNFIFLISQDKKNRVDQSIKLSWTIKELNELPHPSHYPNHDKVTLLMIVFVIFFIIYNFVFSTSLIQEVQHSSYQMIHLMRYFFHPFILMIIYDYFIDSTKKIYTKRYLLNSSIINLFIFIALTIFIFKSSFLKAYLLPLTLQFSYILIDILIITALILIYLIVLFKLLRNIKYYKSLFKK